MSIRLKLSLTYSLILGLTLIIFSTVLYFSQARITLREFQTRLAARPFLEASPSAPRLDGPRRPRPPGPIIFSQIRNLSGEVVERDANLGDFELPLSRAGYQALQDGQPWVERAEINGERFMVQSRLVSFADGKTRIVQVAGSVVERERYLETLRNLLITGSLIATLAAFGIGWILAGITLRPINRIRQTAHTIGQEKDFSKRVDYKGPNDEISALATTINGMLRALQTAYLHVEDSLKTQQRFVADASHELRTPLTTLQGNIELLQRQPPISPEDQADVLADMTAESARLIRLVNDLLTLARSDAQREMQQLPIPLQPLLEEVCQQIQRLDPARQIEVNWADRGQVKGDPDALRQVLLILLDNALKHTPSDAKIRVNTQIQNNQGLIIVQDEGPGIPAAILPHIFDRFYQGDAARTGASSGLGLAIAKELVEAQQGTITVESSPDVGTTFTVALPL